jgi:hypothetical protein
LTEETEWPSLKLARKRRILGIIVPLVNLPLLVYNIYRAVIVLTSGSEINSGILIENFILVASSLLLTFAIPRFFPIYESKYYLDDQGVTLKRLLRKKIVLNYGEIDRIELFQRVDDEISTESKDYATDHSANLRKSGFKFKDYTNAEKNILNIFHMKDIYMISPEKPKTLVKELRRKNNNLSALVVELTSRGKRVREFR